jgi:hypothetical protein
MVPKQNSYKNRNRKPVKGGAIIPMSAMQQNETNMDSIKQQQQQQQHITTER